MNTNNQDLPYMSEVLYKGKKLPAPNLIPEAFTGEFCPAVTTSELHNNVYIPTWENKPIEMPTIVTLNGTGILTNKNMAAIIAHPGTGKSSIMEAVASSILNPDADNLGFYVDPSTAGIIFIDNERTESDVWNSFYRVCRRAGIAKDHNIDKFKIAGLRYVPKLDDRKKAIEYLLETYPCGLLILDGAGDLVRETNDEGEAIECRLWMREIMYRYGISILTTLHPNPNGNKPRGWIGSEVLREAECIMLAKSYDSNTKILTSDFEHGKSRNNPKLSTAFTWSDESRMFVSAEFEELAMGKATAKAELDRGKLEGLAKKVITASESLTHTELCNSIIEIVHCSEATAMRRIKKMKDEKILIVEPDGNYRFNN